MCFVKIDVEHLANQEQEEESFEDFVTDSFYAVETEEEDKPKEQTDKTQEYVLKYLLQILGLA